MIRLLALLLFCLPGTAFANFISSDGDAYEAEANASGVVLTSLYPKFRFIEAGAASRVIEGREKLYLGKACDAFAEPFGNGTWGWANGGFILTFDGGKRLAFPRQEPPEGANLDCVLR